MWTWYCYRRGIAFSSTATASRSGFPPSGTTSWGDSYEIGEGEISTFSTVTLSGKPKYIGVHFSEGALSELPYVEDFEDGDVWVEDNDPNGSVFVVELPIQTPSNNVSL